MFNFILRRLGISLILLFLISLISFFIVTLAPGSPYPWGDLNPKIDEKVKEAYQKKFHLDRPLIEQYGLIMRDLFTGRLQSMKDERPVMRKIGERLPATLALNITSLAFALSFGLVWGIFGARRAGTTADVSTSILAFLCFAIPEFLLAYMAVIVLVKVFAVPILGLHSYGIDFANPAAAFLDTAWHVLIPALVLALGAAAAQSRYVRASLLETLREDYIRTARAKGLAEEIVFIRHALRNSIRPLVTGIGALLPALIGGAVVVESIFAYPGIGRLGYEAVLERDYPTLVALNFITAALVLMGNLLSDLLYAVVDPRVRLE